MEINVWKYSELKQEELQRILRRSESNILDVVEVVKPIIEDVRQRGDAALIEYAEKFDKAIIKGGLKATDQDFEEAYKKLDPVIIDSIKICAENVRIHHQQQMDRVEKQWMEEVRPGQFAGEKITAIPSVGLYVPRGKGAFPSSVFMLSMPAVIAGVKDIAICTPPTPEGGLDAASLVAADICGVRNVFKAGGAQAIAALAYGTETIPKVVKVEGPGNPYVAAAKKVLSDIINPGMPAGPSDSIVLADETANAWNTALDMMNEQEHGADSASILVTTSETFAQEVKKHLEVVINSLPEERKQYCVIGFNTYGGIMICDDMKQAIEFCNEYAPEHILIKVKNTKEVLDKINNAGEILMGETTPMTMGNYGVGVNHVLPTGQNAKTYDCTSVWTFLKRTSLSYLTPQGFSALKKPVADLARYEGFAGHAKAVDERDETCFKKMDL